ncbi:MAG: hypothetical protein KC800_03950 [Candidatus Eremiobacteraeota bacterium]|nr:hypothetical protein [Candidatus Eremiobacteraeota bacterium]
MKSINTNRPTSPYKPGIQKQSLVIAPGTDTGRGANITDPRHSISGPAMTGRGADIYHAELKKKPAQDTQLPVDTAEIDWSAEDKLPFDNSDLGNAPCGNGINPLLEGLLGAYQ